MARRLRDLALVTAGLTYALMLLGLYTGAVGAGLSCQAQWPLCDGGLFPQHLPSVPEWAHRAVAGVTGLFILGTAALAWRDGAERRVRLGAAGAVVATPLQYAIGALTVTLGGLFPQGFSGHTRAAHFTAALVIFALVVAVAAWTRPGDRDRRAHRATLAAAALVPLHLLFVRGAVFAFTPAAQVVFYGVSLALFTALFVAALSLRGRGSAAADRAATLGAVAAFVLYLELVLGRGLTTFTAPVQAATYLLAGLVVVLVGATLWQVRRAVTA